ncbi:hypothetical protein H6F89_03525 [Cyanobacteria bacterium FACHB-63]|nr:hypothetical protein [Cyanobacteria bacterium FACHB-63]
MNADDVELLDWFVTCDRSEFPIVPFRLTTHQIVTGGGFFDVLTRETFDAIDYLKGDRSAPPVRLAGLLKDLKALQALTQMDDDDTDW